MLLEELLADFFSLCLDIKIKALFTYSYCYKD